jgi:hypothetical protein
MRRDDAVDGSPHRPLRWWEVVGPVVMIVGVVGGWVWFLATDHARASDVIDRVVSLEHTRDQREQQLLIIDQRLTRIETMLEVLLKRSAP